MTPGALAALHARAFEVPRPWSVAEFAALLRDPGVVVLVEPLPGGFTPPAPPVGYFCQEEDAIAGVLMARVVLDEAEILTLAVEPALQGRGIGQRLMARFVDAMSARGALRAFLEVAEDNLAARAVYARAGFVAAGRRRGYYVTPKQQRVDALVLTRELPGF